MSRTKPVIFVGSSKERLKVVNALHAELSPDATFLRWDKHVFAPGRFSLEDVETNIRQSDFAIFVIAGDDIVKSRKKVTAAPRDNVVLEVGIAIGVLTHRRLLLVYSKNDRPKIPSDLLGFTYTTYENRRPIRRGVAAACALIRQQLIAEGLRELPTDSDKVLSYQQRAAFSKQFARKTLGTFDTFGGDLDWLAWDLQTYRRLVARKVQLRFLTDTPNAPVIQRAKALKMSFRQYPKGADVSIKASLSDADDAFNARALVVQKRTLALHANASRGPFEYRMKIYHAPDEYLVIDAMRSLFENLFAHGKRL